MELVKTPNARLTKEEQGKVKLDRYFGDSV